MTISVKNSSGTNTTISTIDDLLPVIATSALQTSGNNSIASILAKIIAAPATEAKQDLETAAVNRVGTRAYGTILRVAVAAAASQSAAITATEVLLHASTKCYVLAGSGTPIPTASTGIPVEAGEKFHMRITSGFKIGVIRDTVDGFLHIAAVI